MSGVSGKINNYLSFIIEPFLNCAFVVFIYDMHGVTLLSFFSLKRTDYVMICSLNFESYHA